MNKSDNHSEYETTKIDINTDLPLITEHFPNINLDEIIGTVVSDGASPNFFLQKFRLKVNAHTHVGKMVAILAKTTKGQESLILAQVTNVREQNPHEDPLNATVRDVLPFETRYAPEGESTVIFRVADTIPLEEAILDEDGNILKIRSPESLPRSGMPVFIADEKLIIKALGLESDPNHGFFVGHVYGDWKTPVALNKGIIQRHVLIVGGIGSGKSWTRGVLAEELASFGVPQINIDVNGEMIEATRELNGVNLVPGKSGFTLPLSALSAADVIDAIPAINRGTNIETLVSYAHESLLKSTSGGYFTVDDLVKKIKEIAPQLDMNKAATLQPATLRAESLKNIEYIGKPYDWEKELTPGKIINIDCRNMLISDLRLITASVARDIQRLAKKEKIPFVVISIDECHLVAPNNDNSVTTQVLREVARIGRHYRIGLILTTQSPQDLDRSILKRLLTRFLHSVEPDQLESLRGVFSDASQELVKQLPKLPQGVCVLTGAFETVRHATVIDVRERVTTHGGKTPDIFGDLANRGWSNKKILTDIVSKK